MEDDDWRLASPRFSDGNLEKNLALAAAVRDMADEKGISPAQLALAWVLNQGPDITPIPGTKRIKYLEDNAGATEVSFTEGELCQIQALFPQGSASGERY
ncbi:MAG: aldo/keto reductase [Halioglobus sp.]